MSNTHTSNSE